MIRVNAETIALRALAWIADDEHLLSAFLAASGCSPAEIKASAADPAFLGGVLDFVLQEDERILEVCRAIGLDPPDLTRARRALPGSVNAEF